ncbi:hypothetical protein [Halonotius sp. GCM10025705]|uniref:hypothetical protein n=1 Tax=Halonotius sp. GCM10025705 TaxID=3252678 RepID=UPI003611F308
MHRRRLGALLAGSLPLALAGCQTDRTDDEADTNETASGIPDFTTEEQAAAEALDPDWPTGPYASYETTPVVVRGDDGELRGAVLAAIADTSEKSGSGSARPSRCQRMAVCCSRTIQLATTLTLCRI